MKTHIEASNELSRWLDMKRITPTKRMSCKEEMELLIGEIMTGHVQFNDDLSILQLLRTEIPGKLPFSNFSSIKSLTYKAHLKISEVHIHTKNLKGSDDDGRACAYIAALTGQPMSIARSMDSIDFITGQSIAIFYL